MSDDVRPSALTTLGGLAVAFTGFMQAVAGWQVLSLVDWYSHWILPIWVWTLAIAGGVAVLAGFVYTRSSLVGMVFSLLSTGWIAFVGAGWVIFALLNGMFTATSACSVVMGFVGLLLALVAAPPTVRFWKARRELQRL